MKYCACFSGDTFGEPFRGAGVGAANLSQYIFSLTFSGEIKVF